MVERLTRWLIHTLYPASWRERYGPEFEALLENVSPLSLATLWDIVKGGLDARWRTEWRPRNLRQRLALLASVWAVGAGIVFWFMPTSQACTTSSTGLTHCAATSVVASMPGLAAVSLTVLTVAFGVLPFLARRSTTGLWAWGGLVLGFFVLSFGIDVWGLPAAVLAVLAASCPPRFRDEAPVHADPS